MNFSFLWSVETFAPESGCLREGFECFLEGIACFDSHFSLAATDSSGVTGSHSVYVEGIVQLRFYPGIVFWQPFHTDTLSV